MLSLVLLTPAVVQLRGAAARVVARFEARVDQAPTTESFRGGMVPTNRGVVPTNRGGVVPTNRGRTNERLVQQQQQQQMQMQQQMVQEQQMQQMQQQQQQAYPVQQQQPSTTVQGGALRTWSQHYPTPEHNQVVIGTDGRPLDANLEVWQGPGNTPRRVRVYSEDGFLRPFHTSEAPRGQANTMAVRNTGPLEFPIHTTTWATAGGPHPLGPSMSVPSAPAPMPIRTPAPTSPPRPQQTPR